MEPKITEKAWNPELEHQVLKKWEESGLGDRGLGIGDWGFH